MDIAEKEELLRQADEEFWKWIKRDRVYQLYFYSLIKWKQVELAGKKLSDCFAGRSVAVYGAGMVGELVCKELIKDQIDVRYVLDRTGIGSVRCDNKELRVISIDDASEKVDYILVSVTPYIDEVEKDLQRLAFSTCVLTIDDVIEKLLGESE